MELFRFSGYYIMDDGIDEKITININCGERALECVKCMSFKCKHIIIIWKDQHERNYLEKFGFLNPITRIV